MTNWRYLRLTVGTWVRRRLDKVAKALGYSPTEYLEAAEKGRVYWRGEYTREANAFIQYRSATVGRRITDASADSSGARASYALKEPAFPL